MGRTKLEKEFSKKLNAREIEPSLQAWDRLDAMLTVGEEQREQPVRRLNWLYIAAGFLGFLFVGMSLYNRIGKTDNTNAPVVNVEKTIPNDPAPTQTEIAPVAPITPNEAVAEAPNPKTPKQVAPIQKKLQPLHKKAPEPKQESMLAVNEKPSMETGHDPIIQNQHNANVDELLADAQDSHDDHPKKSVPKMKVDASNLLSQVDGELEMSFREKTIQALGKKYQNVKVALANRNNQQ